MATYFPMLIPLLVLTALVCLIFLMKALSEAKEENKVLKRSLTESEREATNRRADANRYLFENRSLKEEIAKLRPEPEIKVGDTVTLKGSAWPNCVGVVGSINDGIATCHFIEGQILRETTLPLRTLRIV